MKIHLFIPLIFIFTANNLHAQDGTKKEVLIQTSKELALDARNKFAKAVLTAKEKGWPIQYVSQNQNNAKLIGIDEKGWPKYYISFADPVQATTINVNKVWPGAASNLNLSGSDDLMTNKLGVWDEGSPLLTHKELTGRITQKDNATEVVTHSTHVAGIVMSKGLNPLSKGMAYNVKGILDYDWNRDLSEMASAAANGLLISNHSYGTVAGWDQNADSANRWEFNGRWNENEDYRFGVYDADAQIQDSIAYNAPNYLIIAAAGNNRTSVGPAVGQTYWRKNESGKMINAGNRPAEISSNDSYGSIVTDKNAKNVLTVGAVNGIPSGYNKKEGVVMSTFSSWGPTDDGRIKPDIVAQGVSVYAPVASNDSSYAYLSGTSMAAPGAAGGLLLLQELSHRFTLNGAPRILKSATVKGLAIHTANEAGLYPGPDYKFGWGLLNISEAAQVLNSAFTNNNSNTSPHLIYEDTLLNGGSKSYTITGSGIGPVKATIVWTDVKGSSSDLLNDVAPELINDLDLVITQGNKTFNTWNLSPTSPDNQAFKGINSIDNVEKVEVDTSLVGTNYTVTLKHKGTLERGQQNYSLIISGAGGKAYCSSTATSTAGTKIDSIQLNNIKFSKTTTDNYVDNSALFVNGEANGTVSLFMKLSSADSDNNRFVKVFIDYNNNGVFDANELVHTSAVLKNGDYSTNFSLPGDLIINQFTKLRVVVTETALASNVIACGNYTAGETQDYTLRIVNPSNDVQLLEITNPVGGVSDKAFQYITVKVANNGTNDLTNIPITLEVKKGNETILNSTETFKGRLYGSEVMSYTFQKPISIELSQTYTIKATTNLTNDQQTGNNSMTATIMSASPKSVITASATDCNGNVQLLVSNSNSNEQYLWYDNNNDLSKPIANTITASTSTKAENLYVGRGWNGFIGPKDNTTLSNSGGYSNWSSNYGEFTRFNTTGPLQVETAKIYTGYAGKIEIELRALSAFTDSTYSYYPSLSQKTILHVGASSPSPTPATANAGLGAATPFVQGDTGRVYAININITQAGNYILIARCLDSATIFRNNNITTNNYPFGPTVLATITGNWARPNFEKFYYFFYNMQISTPRYEKTLTKVPVKISIKPVITQIGIDSLITTAADSYQWYMNEEAISGGTNRGLKVTKNAMYKVNSTTGTCNNFSENKLVLITDIPQAPTKEIGLKIVSTDYVENIIKGNQFFIQFNNVKTNAIGLSIINSNGQTVFQKDKLNNQITAQPVQIPTLSTGIYYIKVFANNKVYVQSVFVTNN